MLRHEGACKVNSITLDKAKTPAVSQNDLTGYYDYLAKSLTRVQVTDAAGSSLPQSEALPMGGTAANGTDILGELKGLLGLHIVYGAVLSTLLSKHATLTIMANADRIGTALSRL